MSESSRATARQTGMETTTASTSIEPASAPPARRWGGFFALLVAILALFATWRLGAFVMHGSAWGGRARTNAEVEALRYARAHFDPTLAATAVVCHTNTFIEADCDVRLREVSVSIECDDDEASDNDGCTYKSSRPFGLTSDME